MAIRVTTEDWLKRAAAATDPGERAAALVQAEAAARVAADWQGVADAFADAGDRAAAERCLEVALQRAGDDVWDHRRAAATWLRLGDRPAATRALAALAAVFAARSEPRGYQWRLLAEGYSQLLQDTSAVRHCLELGRAAAATVDDLCAVAQGFVELLGDRATALPLVVQAEALAKVAVDAQRGTPDVQPHWAVAIAWTQLFGDAARARASLVTGTARAADVRGCLVMATAWSSHGGPSQEHRDDVRGCLAKAGGLASTFADWFEIAEAMRLHHAADGEVRDALQRALALASLPSQRRKLARALRDWFGDAAAAAGLGPPGLTPDELAAPGPSQLGWPRDPGALFDWLRARLDEPALASIAAADHEQDRREHLAVLLDIWRTGRVPVPLEWCPREVLELRRWDEGLAVDHEARAFCCTLSCLAEIGDESQSQGGIEDTLAVLVESCAELGGEALARLPGLLVVLIDRGGEPGDGERAFALLALLLVAVRLDAGDARLEALAARLLQLDVELVGEDGYPHPERGFVLGATFFDQRLAVWQGLVRDTFGGLQVAPSRPALATVARRLLAGC